MSQQGFEVSGRNFRNSMDYQAAIRDQELIEKIRLKYDLKKREQVSLIKRDLEDKRYHFETLLGDDFYDEMCELWDSFNNLQGLNARKEVNKKANIQDNGGELQVSLDDYDEPMKQEIIRQLKKQENKRRLIVTFLSIVAAASLGYLAFYTFYYQKNNVDYKQLADLKDENTGVKVHLTEEKDKPPILAKYKTLYEKNKRLIGWLKIDDTNIDYPIMQTVNNEYYLDHNYNQEYDKNGSLFLDKDCNAAFPNTNMIIYGHHMKSGNMFGNLNYYSKESYFKEHPQFQFDTIYEEGVYDVMYVFRSRIYSEEEIVFKYYQFFDATSADEFYSYMDAMTNLSLYDTGVTASYGDKLITLSTCDSSEEDGRFVVVAKKVK